MRFYFDDNTKTFNWSSLDKGCSTLFYSGTGEEGGERGVDEHVRINKLVQQFQDYTSFKRDVSDSQNSTEVLPVPLKFFSSKCLYDTLSVLLSESLTNSTLC